MTATLAALVLREDNAGLRLLRLPLIARVGAISYGIYLYHLIALDIANRAFGLAGVANDWALLAAYSLLSVLIAEISFRTLEAWFRRFRPKPGPAPQPG
jgi:peptidoglycan/LPS O-acetylase OafA/YrhL